MKPLYSLGISVYYEVLLLKLSVIVITKNEASNIEACLDSVAFADEVVVLDSGSADDTVAIAKRCGALVAQRSDWQGFGIQKNRALELATHEWILSLDADERVTAELASEIQSVISACKSKKTFEIYAMPRRTSFCGQWIDHCGWSPDVVTRLFRRGSARFSEDLVHESVQAVDGPLATQSIFKNPLLHYSYPTPNHYWDKLKIYSEAWARQKLTEGKNTSILRALASAVVAFVRSYVVRRGFLDGAMGFVVCQMQAQATFYKYFYLYFLNRRLT